MVLVYRVFLLSTTVVAISMRLTTDPTQYLGVTELQAPGYMAGSTTSSGLSQASYSQQILSPTARIQLDQFTTMFDKFSATLGETKFGRAKLVNPPKFDNITCCYPDFSASLALSQMRNTTANLTTTAVQQ
jgi:hypothetical protein